MSQTFNSGSSLHDDDEEYEYEYVEEEVVEGEDAEDGVEYEYEEVEYEEVEENAEAGVEYEYVEEEAEEGVEYEYVDENGNPVESEDEEVEYEYVEEPAAPVTPTRKAAAAAQPVVADNDEYTYETYEVEVEEEVVEEVSRPAKPEVVVQDKSFTPARQVPSFLVSATVHIAVLLGMGMITEVIPLDVLPPVITTEIAEPLTAQEFKFDTTVQDVLGAGSKMDIVSPSMQAATRPGLTPQEAMEQKVDENFQTDEAPPPVSLVDPHESELVSTVDLTGATEYIGGTEGAIDRLAFEITASLKEGKTLVVWLFDASLSLDKQRAAIADRFDNVYAQVGALDPVSAEEKALKTAVMSFGQDFKYLTEEPVDDVAEVSKLVRGIPNDVSGKEMIFSAVDAAAKKFRVHRTTYQRNIMFIVVTDERGDDYGNGKLEATIATCRRYGIKVYTVGPACIFGKEKSFVNWTYEDGFTEELPVDGGPETVAQESLSLGFWGVNGRDLERMSAGYGPYALTRLSGETGGLYLINSDTSGPRFDPIVMKNYIPDYRPLAVYQKELDTNLAKNRLVEVGRLSNRTDAEVPSPQLSFDADTDAILREQITEAQKTAAVFDAAMTEWEAILTPGEKDREKLTTPRWRASFDLAMGRVLAMRARAYGYNAVLADMKATPKVFEKKGSNSWRLKPSIHVNGTTAKKLAKTSSEYLTRVIDEHPGTPWALLAERELSTPMGWDWEEYAVPRVAMNNNNNNNDNAIQLAEEEQRREQMRRQQMQRKKPNL